MNKRTLLLIGGIVNVIFVLFHIGLGYVIHVSPVISQADRPLMEMLNAGGLLLIAFLTIASLFYFDEVLTTKIGRLTILLCIALYWSRAIEEIFISPSFSIMIFVSCIFVGLIYLPLLFPARIQVEHSESITI
jgi:hypothetical protein